jgi:hypothetical protein
MLKARFTLRRFSKKRLIVLLELEKKDRVSSNLIDLHLVEYSTSKLEKHIKKKSYPSGTFKSCLLKVSATVLLVAAKST